MSVSYSSFHGSWWAGLLPVTEVPYGVRRQEGELDPSSGSVPRVPEQPLRHWTCVGHPWGCPDHILPFYIIIVYLFGRQRNGEKWEREEMGRAPFCWSALQIPSIVGARTRSEDWSSKLPSVSLGMAGTQLPQPSAAGVRRHSWKPSQALPGGPEAS